MNTSSVNAFMMELKMSSYTGSFEQSTNKSSKKNNGLSTSLDTDYSSMNAQVIKFEMSVVSFTGNNTSSQSFADFFKNIDKALQTEEGKELKKKFEEEVDVYSTGYEGKPITELTKEEADALVSDDGFFGVSKTSQRVADFVLSFANGNLDLLSKGRDGLMKGFKWAEDLWGEELPEISYNTLKETLKKVDEEISKNGGSILDQQA